MQSQVDILTKFAEACWQLQIDYDLCSDLFFQSDRHTELLQATAPYLFGDLCRIVRNHLFVGFCSVTDPAGTGQRVNLTTNFILELDWEPETKARLKDVNARLMSFRKHVEPARSKRIAHMDLHAQIEDRRPLGAFPPGAEKQFFKDLEEFLTIAYQALNRGPFSLSVAVAGDTHRLFRALTKATLFDQCQKCDGIERSNAILDLEQEI